jgi:ATP-binding cassette subfamily F protein uup
MLQPADVLLLDEPTNDLDIPTLEILEESLLEYRGALVLVTHDRYMLDRVSTIVLGLDGSGAAERFADYSQWEEWLRSQQTKPIANESARATRERTSSRADQSPAVAVKKQLSHAENREFASIEKRMAKAEEDLQTKRSALENPEIASDASRLHEAYAEMEAAQKVVDELYRRRIRTKEAGTLGEVGIHRTAGILAQPVLGRRREFRQERLVQANLMFEGKLRAAGS